MSIIRGFLLFFVFLGTLMFMGRTTYGEAFDVTISPKEFYDEYEDKVIYNTKDDKIYWTTRGKSTGTSASTGYQRKAIRYNLVGTDYYVDTLSSKSDYNEYETETVSNYYYNMYKVKLSTLLELFSRKYPDVDFTRYFEEKFTIEIDALMSIRVKNIYQCYDDLSDGTEDKGILASAKAGMAGKSAYTGLYASTEAMEKAYSAYAVRNFDTWYDRRIDITPSNPQSSIDYDIKVTVPIVSGGNNYRYNTDLYYVKAGLPFSLSFSSSTYYEGKISANATYQPSVNGIMVTNKVGDLESYIWVYHYFTSPFGANVSTFTDKSTYDLPYATDIVTQKRSSNLTTLYTVVTMSMEEKGYVPQFKSMSRLYVGTELAKAVESSAIKIIPDGTPPTISGVTAPNDWISADSYKVKVMSADALSGVRGIYVYCDNILMMSEAGMNIGYSVTKQGETVVKIVSQDNVGNESIKEMTVRLDNVAPNIIMEESYEFEEEAVTEGYVTVDMVAKDGLSGVSRIEVYDGESLVAYKIFSESVDETSFNMTLNADVFANKFKDFSIKVWDKAGNISEKLVSMKYNKKEFVKPIVVGTH